MIDIVRLRKRYKDGTVALKGVSLSFDKQITTVIGRNGAGKTTLMRILSTQLLPSSGRATVDGLDVVKDAEALRKKLVSIPQEASPMGFLTPMEHLKTYLIARGSTVRQAARDAEDALRTLELYDARNTPSDELSGGMKRKIFVAMALAANADVVFLDEPTTGLDPLSRLEVWSAVKMLKGTLVLTTHYMEEAAELSDEIAMVDNGEVIGHGTMKSLLKRFNGMVRAETTAANVGGKYTIGNTKIMYIREHEAERYVEHSYTIKPITLEDLFVIRGVELES
ncbi:ABC transporter ATP-binding protein [Candidatus Marsarchaeota archaeon]|nr:ABC transporter ATP-binding protein [Candidatus Marsarchaeota archaeon]MCL5100034.1 ABC transporter ATP-binding protein [Candidatus Marsarchaeota archaeon]